MTHDCFEHLKIGDVISGYTIIKIDNSNGMLYLKRKTSNCCSFQMMHYSLFLIYNKILKKYE